ncbi:hypothetical protein ACJIZ3_007719 [Penstemon smallii]|uniref:NPH3 domain-containing protein n=1 Tax=Penstemon smallii TaxID=265156 RepID=A0ABD3T9P1_9LAMI
MLFFEEQIIPSWNNSIKALKSAENILQQAIQLGIIDHCAESVILKVLENPRLLGEPIKNSTSNDESDENRDAYRPNARRKLFDVNWKSEDLTTLPMRIYAPIIHAMIQRQVPKEYIAANLCQYAEKWVFSGENIEETTPTYTRNYQRETLEAIEQLLPHQKGILPITFLFEMLRFSVFLEAKTECKNGLELRIGKQLDQASVTDLLIPSQEYTNDEQYDTECVRRILKIFYSNYTEPDESSLIAISELMDDFLVEISSHPDINTNTFTAFADISVAASVGTQRTHDRIYRAIDIYLDKHRYLTESEKEELCSILDCNKLSAEACEHAAQNRKLPLRVVVQVMFVGQLKLRNAIVKEIQGSEIGSEVNGSGTGGEEEVRAEMEKMGSKVLELERECSVMRREISVKKKEKVSLWREMKRKLGCGTSSVHERDCHVKKKKKKKVHP